MRFGFEIFGQKSNIKKVVLLHIQQVVERFIDTVRTVFAAKKATEILLFN